MYDGEGAKPRYDRLRNNSSQERSSLQVTHLQANPAVLSDNVQLDGTGGPQV
jgi:hypothetical protein